MEEKKNSPYSIAGLVLGIVSIVFGCLSSTIFLGILGLVCGIVGIILAVRGRKEQPGTMATAGLVVSIVGTCISGILFITCGICVCAAASAVGTAANGIYY